MSLETLQGKKFVIIDDDPCTLFYNNAVIKRFFYYSEVVSFKSPSKALDYFYNDFRTYPSETVVLLDINMPELSGWDVLNKLKMLPGGAKEKLSIIILSSSIDPADKLRADNSSLVLGFIEKPFSVKKLKDLMDLKESLVKKVDFSQNIALVNSINL